CARALAHTIEHDCDQENAAAHDVLVEGRHIEEVERVLRGTHNENTDDDADDAGNAAREGDAAEHAGGNDREFEPQRRVRLTARDAGGENDTREPRDEPLERKDGDLYARNRHAGEPRRLRIAADRENVLSENGRIEDHAEDDEAKA